MKYIKYNYNGIREGLIHLPAVAALKEIHQSPKHHPEGTAFAHTLGVIDEVARIGEARSIGNDDMLVLLFAAALHDIGKAKTGAGDPERGITFHRHAEAGVEIAAQILGDEYKGLPEEIRARVLWLVGQHMRVCALPEMRPSKREALMAHPDFEMLMVLYEADARSSNMDLSALRFVESVQQRAFDKWLDKLK